MTTDVEFELKREAATNGCNTIPGAISVRAIHEFFEKIDHSTDELLELDDNEKQLKEVAERFTAQIYDNYDDGIAAFSVPEDTSQSDMLQLVGLVASSNFGRPVLTVETLVATRNASAMRVAKKAIEEFGKLTGENLLLISGGQHPETAAQDKRIKLLGEAVMQLPFNVPKRIASNKYVKPGDTYEAVDNGTFVGVLLPTYVKIISKSEQSTDEPHETASEAAILAVSA